MHIGIPVLNKKPNMVYNEWGKFWVNESVDAYDYKIEYLKFEEGTRFPEILSKQPHVAYKVDDADPYLEDADRIIFGPEALGDRSLPSLNIDVRKRNCISSGVIVINCPSSNKTSALTNN